VGIRSYWSDRSNWDHGATGATGATGPAGTGAEQQVLLVQRGQREITG